MIRLGVLLLLIASAAWGQTRPVSQNLGGPWTYGNKEVLKLKCGKYQHFVPAHEEDCSNSLLGCMKYVDDACVDNMHEVTEREWQELINTLDEGLHAQLDYDKATQAQIDVLVREIDRLQVRLKALEKERKP